MCGFEIVVYQQVWAREIADLFHRAVHAIDPEIYSPEQQEAWAPTPPDYEAWRRRLAEKVASEPPLVAVCRDQGERVVGFMELDPDGHIDCAYTDPDVQGQGVAGALYRRQEARARALGCDRMFVEASHLAKPFFAGRGFVVLRENQIVRKGEILINHSMEKRL